MNELYLYCNTVISFKGRNVFFNLDGVHTVLCIDISESMLDGNGWEHTTTFVKDFLNGNCIIFSQCMSNVIFCLFHLI